MRRADRDDQRSRDRHAAARPRATGSAAGRCAGALLAAALATLVGPLGAEEAELVTDRPDQTESAETVPPRTVQVELGVSRIEGEGGASGADVDELGATLVRIGLAADWELRAGWGGRIDPRDGGARSGGSGAADTELGAKWRIGRSASGRTTVALLASTTLPTGSGELTSDRFDPELRLSVAHELGEQLGLGWNVGVANESGIGAAGKRRTESFLFATAALGFELSPRVGAFVELFGEGGGSRGGAPALSFDGGLTLLLAANVQLDLAAGIGLSSSASDRFVGVGVSFRLPR